MRNFLFLSHLPTKCSFSFDVRQSFRDPTHSELKGLFHSRWNLRPKGGPSQFLNCSQDKVPLFLSSSLGFGSAWPSMVDNPIPSGSKEALKVDHPHCGSQRRAHEVRQTDNSLRPRTRHDRHWHWSPTFGKHLCRSSQLRLHQHLDVNECGQTRDSWYSVVWLRSTRLQIGHLH